MIVAIPLLAPPVWLLGFLVRSGLAAIAEGSAGSASASAMIAGAFAGILGVAIGAQIPYGTPAAAALVMVAIAAFAWFEKKIARWSRTSIENKGAEPEPSLDEPFRRTSSLVTLVRGLTQGRPTLPAFGAGITAAMCTFAAQRLFSFTEGNELGGFPVATLMLLAGCVAGSSLGVLAPRRWLETRGGQVCAAAICACALVVLWTWMRFDQLPPRFVEWTQTKIPFISLVANAGRLIGARVVLPGMLLGFALAVLARDLPSNPERRGSWLLQSGAFGIAGLIAARAILAVQLPDGHLEGALRATALAAGLAGALGIVAAGRFSLTAALTSTLGALFVVLSVKSSPDPVRDALLVERNLPGGKASITYVQKSWLIFDEDGWDSSCAVLRRGHGRRLLMNGRHEVSNESVKSHGLLAHLPLLLHPNPRTVLVLGSGNGLALSAALAHPVERVECFEAGRVPVRATARFGQEAQSALRDARLGVRIGDFEDLLARSPSVDVILNQSSGSWSQRSAQTSTREFLELAKSRLNEGGMYCQWIPESVLTKEGIKILLATFVRVFPQVQAWSSQSGDLLLLARAEPQSLNLAQLQNRFSACNCSASLQHSWIEDPVTFLSNYLASDATLRKIAGSTPIHERKHPRLTHEEAARRRGQVPVNPVPGMAALGDDVLAEMAAADGSWATLVHQGVEARKLEREGLDFEVSEKTYEAIDAYQRALELNPRDGSVRRSMASLRTRMGIRYVADRSWTAAHQNLRAAVETDTTFAHGFANLGGLLLYTGPPDYAISTTFQAIELEPDDDLAWTQLGHIRRKQGLLEEAIPYYERALALNPQNADAAMSYVDSKLELDSRPENIAEAVRYLESFLPLEPENEDLIYRLGKYRDAMRRGFLVESELPDSTAAITTP
jgi:tetratricopeptide (TPR) repeat protein